MNKNFITQVAVALAFGLRAFATDLATANPTPETGKWISKPGVPAKPAIATEFWATNEDRDLYTARKNWDDSGVMGFVPNNPALPNVLIIGDSISMGYTLDVRQLLKGKANVYRIKGNGGDATRFLKKYANYLGAGTNWDLIHFNWGLHDLVRQDPATKTYTSTFPPRYTEAEYSNHLEQCLAILKSTGAHLVWASTTPVPPNAAGRITGDEVTRNSIAANIMKQNGIEVDDLYSLMKNHEDLHAGPGNVHYTGVGYLEMAKQITGVISNKLGIGVNTAGETARAALLVNHWRFDNNYQDTVTRTEGKVTDEKAFAFAPGQLSPCLYCKSTGPAKYLSLATSSVSRPEFSATMWFKVESLKTSAATLLEKSGDTTNSSEWQISLRRLKGQTNSAGESTNGGIWFRIGSPAQNIRFDRPAFKLGKWHHLACTFNSGTGVAEIYVDGVMLTRASGITQSPVGLDRKLKIGAGAGGFKGWVDDLQIWDGVLTASQIKELFDQEGG